MLWKKFLPNRVGLVKLGLIGGRGELEQVKLKYDETQKDFKRISNETQEVLEQASYSCR